MDTLTRRIHLTALKMDLALAADYSGYDGMAGKLLLPAFRNGLLDDAIRQGRIGQAYDATD